MLHNAPATNANSVPVTMDQSVIRLNQSHLEGTALDVLRRSIRLNFPGKIALVSSFGAESVVLLHLVSQIDKTLPVIFLDTQFHFQETLEYQKTVANALGLTNIVTAEPDATRIFQFDPGYDLHQSNQDQCCALRKTAPLQKALTGYDAWITGRKRHQNPGRASLELFEQDKNNKFKVNPLIYWTPDQVKNYILDHDLPRHPLVKSGYQSIGCKPCTTPVRPGEDPRSGRWRNKEKQECGIHITLGQGLPSNPKSSRNSDNIDAGKT